MKEGIRKKDQIDFEKELIMLEYCPVDNPLSEREQ